MILWVSETLLVVVLAWSALGLEDRSLVLPTAAAVIAWGAIAVGFWRGNAMARWLALVPAGLFGIAALVFWGLSSICTSSLMVAFSCPPGPLPPVSLAVWLIRMTLVGAAGVLVAGVLLPGRNVDRGRAGRSSDRSP